MSHLGSLKAKSAVKTDCKGNKVRFTLWGGAYLKQVFSAFKNKAYKFDPEKIKGAKDFFKNFPI